MCRYKVGGCYCCAHQKKCICELFCPRRKVPLGMLNFAATASIATAVSRLYSKELRKRFASIAHCIVAAIQTFHRSKAVAYVAWRWRLRGICRKIKSVWKSKCVFRVDESDKLRFEVLKTIAADRGAGGDEVEDGSGLRDGRVSKLRL